MAVGAAIGTVTSRPVKNNTGIIDIWDLSSLRIGQKVKQRWQRTTPSPLMLTFEAHDDEVTDVIFSPDGKTLVTSGTDKTVKLWNVATYQLLVTLNSGDSVVNALGFSIDNLMLFGGTKGEVLVWRAMSAQRQASADANRISKGN